MDRLLAFAVVAGLMTMVPGLDTALILRATIAHGRSAGFAAVTGVSLGLLTWGATAAAGIAALLAASRLAYDLLRTAGAIYMVYLGARLIAKTLRHESTPAHGTDTARRPENPTRSALWRGAVTNLLNPKIGVFYMAVLPQFLPESASPLWSGIGLAMIHVVEGFVWSGVLIMGIGSLRPVLTKPGFQRSVDRTAGATIIGLGTKLALSHR